MTEPDYTRLCKRKLHTLDLPGGRTRDGRCRKCNAAYHRQYRSRSAVVGEPPRTQGILRRVLSAVGL